MNRLQFLLVKLAEEGSEIAQISLKTTQFGAHEKCPDQPFSNFERVHQEIDDLLAIVEMLNDECGFNFASNRDRIEAKKIKVNRYAAYSEKLGMVNHAG